MYIEQLIEYGKKNYDEINGDELSGDRSWEYCHEIFKKYRNEERTDEAIDLLCLHLSWYLASWGMLRNSFLRVYSYKVHKEAVVEIYKDEWRGLWNIDFSKVGEEYAGQIMALSAKISEIYKPYLDNARARLGKTENERIGITDTLQTKILLGTVGCVPAYDTYFKRALVDTKIASSTYGKKSLIALAKHYSDNAFEYEKLGRYCGKRVSYPSAKILDMCFFQYGYNLNT